MRWAYGIMTCEQRTTNGLYFKTKQSLVNAGFDKPELFIDANPQMGPYGRFVVSLLTLYFRNDLADRFVIFQDDLIASIGLREYLDAIPDPPQGYWNLFTFPHNQPDQLAARREDGIPTHPNLDPATQGFYPSCQHGKGALALVFTREALKVLVSHRYLTEHVNHPIIGYKGIDCAVCTIMKDRGWTEYVHNPSLVQHIGYESTIHNNAHRDAVSFRGQDYDLRQLIKNR